MNTINNLSNINIFDFITEDNLSEEFFSPPEYITREETDQYIREMSLMKIEIKDLRIENNKLAVLEMKHNMLVGHNKQLCYELKRLQRENEKLKKQIRPNLIKRMWRKMKQAGYNQM